MIYLWLLVVSKQNSCSGTALNITGHLNNNFFLKDTYQQDWTPPIYILPSDCETVSCPCKTTEPTILHVLNCVWLTVGMLQYVGVLPFFINVEMPTTSRQGEQVGIRVTVFNYMPSPIEATVVLAGSPDYKFVHVGMNGIVSSNMYFQSKRLTFIMLFCQVIYRLINVSQPGLSLFLYLFFEFVMKSYFWCYWV
jgi:hypothetical protein